MYLAGAFIIAIALLLTAAFLGWQSRTASRLAASRELAAAALSNLQIDPQRSLLLAMQAISTTYTLEAEDALHQSILASHLRRTLPVGNPGAALSVAVSPDGLRIATASAAEIVKVWDSSTGEFLFSLPGHAARFSPDGGRLATVLSGGAVKMWDVATGAEIPLAGHINADMGVEFSPDGTRLVTIPSINMPRIWDVETGEELLSFPGHTDFVSAAIFSPDGSRLLTASDDGTAALLGCRHGRAASKPLRSSRLGLGCGLHSGWQPHRHRQRK